MACDRSIVLAQQEFLRRATDTARGGVALKVLASRADLPEATLRSYGRGDAPAVMPLGALWKLIGAVEAELIELLLPDGVALVQLPENLDHDTLAAWALDFASRHAAARHPASEAGVEISPGEDAALKSAAMRMRAVGGAG